MKREILREFLKSFKAKNYSKALRLSYILVNSGDVMGLKLLSYVNNRMENERRQNLEDEYNDNIDLDLNLDDFDLEDNVEIEM